MPGVMVSISKLRITLVFVLMLTAIGVSGLGAAQTQQVDPRTASLTFVGIWVLSEGTGRDCRVRLKIGVRDPRGLRIAHVAGACATEMSEIDAWAFASGYLLLFDFDGEEIGMFEGGIDGVQEGHFTLANGEMIDAGMVKE